MCLMKLLFVKDFFEGCEGLLEEIMFKFDLLLFMVWRWWFDGYDLGEWS